MKYFILWALHKLHTKPTWWWRPGWCPHPSAVRPGPAPSSPCFHSAWAWWTECCHRCRWTPLFLCRKKKKTDISTLDEALVWLGGLKVSLCAHANSLFKTVLVYLSAEYRTMSVVWSTGRREIDAETLKFKDICETWMMLIRFSNAHFTTRWCKTRGRWICVQSSKRLQRCLPVILNFLTVLLLSFLILILIGISSPWK